MNSNENSSKKILVKITCDLICLLAVGIPIFLFHASGKPYKRGFFCNDESLMHPYLESTVPSWMLYAFGVGLPIVVIIVTELTLNKLSASTNRIFLNRTIPTWIWESYCHIGVFGFGAACSQLTTDIGKYTIGRLRPHFFSVCQPDIDCTKPEFQHAYIEKFNCKTTNSYLLKDMRLSFPSGHSSFSTYCMVFLAAYLQARFTWRGSKLIKHTLQFIALSLASYTALSRISDYKHHPTDVLAGAIQGAVVAILIVVYVSDLYPHKYRCGSNTGSNYPVERSESDVPDLGMKMVETRGYHNNRS